MSKPSIKTIAEQVGVSKTTVSFVLNGRGDEKNISLATQKKILDCAAAHNYRPNYLARSLSLGKSHTIGFVVPDISNPFFGKIVKHVERIAEQHGYSVSIASTDEDPAKEAKIVDSFKDRQIDGIIIAPTSKLEQIHNFQADGQFPMVCFDRIHAEQTQNFVDINNESATEELTETLITQGHTRIGVLSLTSHLPNIAKRLSGYKKALKKNNIEIDQHLIVEIDHHQIKEAVMKAIKHLLTNKQPVTSILFLNNVLAAEGIWTINRFYPELRDHLHFASFDNLELFDYALPKVTSVLQPAEQIAHNCVEMLCQQIDKQQVTHGIHLKSEIIKR